jgi:acetate kinase
MIRSQNGPLAPCILTINGGSSSIKSASFEIANTLQRILEGGIERGKLTDYRIIQPHASSFAGNGHWSRRNRL